MAARVTYYATALSRTATTTTDYSVAKVTTSFLPSANKTYAILWSAVLDGNDTNYSQKVRLQNTTASVTLAEEIMDPRNVTIATSTTSAGGLAIYTAPASPVSQTFQMQFASSDAAMSCGIQEAKLFIIELIDGVDIWASSVAEQTTTSATYGSKVTLSWTPTTAGNYFALASAEVQAIVAEVAVRLYVDGATPAGENVATDYNNPGNWQMYAAAYRHVSISGSHTMALQWASTNAAAAPIRNAYAVALRLDQFESSFWAEDRTEHLSTSATYVNAAAATGTPAAVRYLMVGCGNTDVESDVAYAVSSATRLAVGGVAQGTVFSMQPGWPGAYRNWLDIAVRTEAATSTTWSTQYARAAGATASRTDEHVLGVFQIDAVAAPATGSITYVGAGTATHGIYNVAVNPPLPSGITAGDLLVCFTHLRSNGTITSSWTTHVSNNASVTFLLVSYRIATGSDTAPTITPVGTSGGQHHTSCVLAFRGVDVAAPFGTPGAITQYGAREDLGPIAAATATAADGAVIVFGGCNNTTGGGVTNPALLTGDGLTWIEAVDAQSVDNASHIVVDYAIWEGAAPTLTAKTFDHPGGTTIDAATGVMLLLNPSIVPFAYVGVGASSSGDHTTSLAPPIPAGVAVGDLLITVAYLRNAGTFSISSGWTGHYTLDTTQNGSDFYLRVWYRFATGSDTAPTITITGGVTGPQSLTQSFVVAYRGVHPTISFGNHGADSFNATATSVGPIAVATGALPDYGAAIVLGVRNATVWTSAATLSGDGLTWLEDFDNYTNTVSGVGISLVMNHAIWGGGAPTLTAKTFVPTGGVAGPGMGKMFILNAASAEPVVTQTTQLSANAVVAVPITASVLADCVVSASTGIFLGALATADHVTPMVPALPAGVASGDILIAVAYLRGVGTLGISGGWIQHSLADLPQEIYLQTWYTVYDGVLTAPTITTTGGSTVPQTLSMSFIIAARGYNQANPFGSDGANSVNVTQATIGPIAVPPSLPSVGAVLVTGWRNATVWTSVPTLTGDGLTWAELFDNYTHTVAGRSITGVIDYATWSGSAPALTAKTFSPVGGASAPALGKMFVLNVSPSVTEALLASADAAVAAAPTTNVFADAVVILGALALSVDADASVTIAGTGAVTVTAGAAVRVSRTTSVFADASVGSLTRNVTLSANVSVINTATMSTTISADVSVVVGQRTISQIVFCDTVIIPTPSEEGVLSAVGELSAERTDTAWLVLLTLDHADLPDPIRVTNDGVPTVSGGNVFSPFPFEVILPDDVEGRPPQAQLSIDNTTQEIIAALRGLTSPPKLTVQIVRSTNTDIVEYQWIGLEWSGSSYDKNVVTGTLTFQDITREEFPYETFDGRWQGLQNG